MTPKQLRTTLANLGLSQRAAARLLGIDERTMRKYVAGDLVIPEMLVWALRGLAQREKSRTLIRRRSRVRRRRIEGGAIYVGVISADLDANGPSI